MHSARVVDGLTAPWVLDGAMNKLAFETYVEKVLAPTLRPGDLVIMDNLPSHKGDRVRELIEARGARRLLPPPYSPDLNPIEMAFSKLKALLSTADERSDADLAAAAAAGDDRAYSTLVTRHKNGLYRLLRRYLGNDDEAYEAVQEAFIAAWSALARYDPARPFGAWLRTIAINKARDRGRRIAVRRLIFGSQPFEDSAAQSSVDPAVATDEAIVNSERLADLDRAIARLPPALRAPLILTALEGRSQAEAGAILGLSAKSVETRTYRARKILATVLGPRFS